MSYSNKHSFFSPDQLQSLNEALKDGAYCIHYLKITDSSGIPNDGELVYSICGWLDIYRPIRVFCVGAKNHKYKDYNCPKCVKGIAKGDTRIFGVIA